MISQDFLDMLRCPLNPTGTRLKLANDHLECERCALKFLIKDGFPILVVEEAVPLPASLGIPPTEEVASLGMAALKRLDLVVDVKRGIAYLRPKKTPAPPPSNPHHGPSAASAPRDENSDDLVARVANASPAYAAGIRDGDVLLKIGERDVVELRYRFAVKSGRVAYF